MYLDACHSADGFHPGPVTTLDGLVTALSEQGGWVDVTAPTEITVNGYDGYAFQRTAPAEFVDCDSSFAPFRSWQYDDGKPFVLLGGRGRDPVGPRCRRRDHHHQHQNGSRPTGLHPR
jgi:hypothetical protein